MLCLFKVGFYVRNGSTHFGNLLKEVKVKAKLCERRKISCNCREISFFVLNLVWLLETIHQVSYSFFGAESFSLFVIPNVEECFLCAFLSVSYTHLRAHETRHDLV